MKYTRIVIVLFAAAIAASALSAQETATPSNKTPGVRERQVNQQKRIKEGVRSGELTKKEARKLEAGEAKIQHDKMAAKADGNVTKSERRKLHRELNRESKAIAHQKHDHQHMK